MRKIAIISDHASPLASLGSVDNGGQNIYVKNIARVLASKGYEIDIFTRKDHASLPAFAVMEPGIKVIYVPAGPPRYIEKEKLLSHVEAFSDFLVDYFARQETLYDCIHANFFMSGLAAIKLKARYDIPFFITFHALGRVRRMHQLEKDGFPDKRFQIEDEIVQRADGLIAECPQDRQDLIDHYAADPQKISVIPCGVDLQELKPVEKETARALLNLPKDEKVILQLGRLVPRKGIDTVIQALSLLKKNHHMKVRLLIVGGPPKTEGLEQVPEIARLKKIALDERVSDMVVFCGQAARDEIKYYYSAADIFVTTPWYEPFGITPLEAMACAKPVIGSRVGGIPFSVAEGKTGLLIPPKTPPALAEALGYFYRNPDTIASFGKKGLARVRKYFTWKKVCGSLESWLKEKTEASQYAFHSVPERVFAMRKPFFSSEEA
ncbi:MAG: glycosyltransferase [Candidatus Omnitrophota bacterium]